MSLARCVAAFVLSLGLVAAAAFGQTFPGLGTPVSESYRAKFDTCDRSNRFGSVSFPIRNKAGQIRWYGCSTDPSRFSRFVAVPPAGNAPRAIIFSAKLAHDRDGSPSACSGSRGVTDQCATTLMLDPTARHPCVIPRGGRSACVPVNADEVPYVVIPMAAPPGIDAREFRTLTGVDVGDYGVVVANGRTVPVIVADGGPAYKIGEGSTALLRALDPAGRARTIASGVTYILFPGSRDPRSALSPDTIADTVRTKGEDLFSRFSSAHR